MKKEEREKLIDCPECEEGYISSKDKIEFLIIKNPE